MSHPLDGCFLTAQLPDEKLVAIVKFRDNMPSPQNPAVLFQATIDPKKISPSGHMIRFGQTQGDEIVGWQRRELLQVVEVLGRLEHDGKTVTGWNDEGEENVRTG